MPANSLIRFFPILCLALLVSCTSATPPSPEATVPTLPPSPQETTLPAPTSSAPDPSPSQAPLSLVAIGDSIPFNSNADCPGCTGFVDRYAEAISLSTGVPVEVLNFSQHTGLQIDGLLQSVETNQNLRRALADADIIVAAIAHNDVAWARNDDPCDGPTGDNPNWSVYTPACATAAAEEFRPKFEHLFSQLIALREGKPTVYRTINRYNDWIGWTGGDVPPEASPSSKAILDAWNAMICTAAVSSGFMCADVYHAFNGPDGLTPSLDLLAEDYTHPSDKGNEIIANVLIDLGFDPLAP